LTSHSVRRASAAFGGIPSGTAAEANSPSARQRRARLPNAQPTNRPARRATPHPRRQHSRRRIQSRGGGTARSVLGI